MNNGARWNERRWLLSIVLGSCASAASICAQAQAEFSPTDMKACATEIAANCRGVRNGGGRIVQCVQQAPNLSAACKLAVTPTDGDAGTIAINVTVKGIKSNAGFVFVWLSDSPENFNTGKRMVIVPAANGSVTVNFGHLKTGTYSISAYHDENDNGKFDNGSAGTEGFAASNGASLPPTFSASSLKVLTNIKVEISMKYY